MKWRLITIGLACLTTALGFWAWHTANTRDFSVTFSASGEKAKEWGERAKHDRWVEIVKMDLSEGKLHYVPVPPSDIDFHVNNNRSVFVRRWLPNSDAADMTSALAGHGYSGFSRQATELSESATGQHSKSFWLTLAAVIAGISAVVSGIVAARQPRQNAPTPSTPPVDAVQPTETLNKPPDDV